MSENQRQFIERRSAKRAIAKYTLRYRIAADANAPYKTVTTQDICKRSVSFDTTDMMPIGTKIAGELILPVLAKPISFTGSIVREEVHAGGVYLYAVLFETIEKEDQGALMKCVQAVDLNSILRSAVKRNASDVHFIADKPYYFRVDGELVSQGAWPINAEDLNEMLFCMLTHSQREEFEKNLELNFSYATPEGYHFRVNLHLDKGHVEAALRVIPREIKSVPALGLPSVVEKLARKKKGLILVTGAAGSGKTTTQATMIDIINRELRRMIISIEDPIEYVHENKQSIVKQREVGADTLSFANAIKQSLRQDPNVIFIGEMRDLESISIALTAAETGHLVLTTLHTMGAAVSIKRIVDTFPSDQQNQVFSLLSLCLEGIISQVLLPRKDGKGRVVATEILIATPAIRNLIRTGKIEQIQSYLDTGGEEEMMSLDRSLAELCKKGLIEEEAAFSFSQDPSRLRQYLRK